jgi:hypothetical protein
VPDLGVRGLHVEQSSRNSVGSSCCLFEGFDRVGGGLERLKVVGAEGIYWLIGGWIGAIRGWRGGHISVQRRSCWIVRMQHHRELQK